MLKPKIMIFIGSFVVFLILTTIDAQNECVLPNINCVNILNCPAILSILRGPRPFSERTLQALRTLQCGTEDGYPKVCCYQVEATTLTVTTATTDSEGILEPPDVTNHPNLRLLDQQLCGPSTRARTLGITPDIFDYPWMALIMYDTGKSNPEFLCTGTIISSRYILTAAHCVTSLRNNVTLIGVRVGDYDLSEERDCITDINGSEIFCAERYQNFGVDNFYFHPEFTKTEMQNDIALIRLNDTMDFRPHNIKPICLPFGSAATLKRKKAWLSGWNITESNNKILQQTRMLMVPNDQCKEIYKPFRHIWYKQLCALMKRYNWELTSAAENSSCHGDNGKPLQAPAIYNNISVRYVQYGVASYVMPCGIEGFPGVYTRVAYYMDWILDTMTD